MSKFMIDVDRRNVRSDGDGFDYAVNTAESNVQQTVIKQDSSVLLDTALTGAELPALAETSETAYYQRGGDILRVTYRRTEKAVWFARIVLFHSITRAHAQRIVAGYDARGVENVPLARVTDNTGTQHYYSVTTFDPFGVVTNGGKIESGWALSPTRDNVARVSLDQFQAWLATQDLSKFSGENPL